MSIFDDLDSEKKEITDGSRGLPGQTNIFDEVRPSRTLGGTVKDVGIDVLKGAISVPEAVVGAADIFTGGRVGKGLEGFGFKPAEAKQILEEEYSPARKEAGERFHEAEGIVDKTVAAVTNPSVVASAVLESLPLMGAGGAIARGLKTLGIAARGVSGAVTRSAIGEGTVAAGSAAEGVRQQTDEGLLTAKQSALAGLSGALTGAFAKIGGQAAAKLGIADIDTFLAGSSGAKIKKNLARRVVEGFISEGFLEELPQSVQEQMISNISLDNPVMDGVDEAAVLGSLSGGLMGGGFNIAQTLGSGGIDDVVEAEPPKGPLGRAAAAGGLGLRTPAFIPDERRGEEAIRLAAIDAQREGIRENLEGLRERSRGIPSTAAEVGEIVSETPETLLEMDVAAKTEAREKRAKELEQTLSTIPTEEQVEIDKVAAGAGAAEKGLGVPGLADKVEAEPSAAVLPTLELPSTTPAAEGEVSPEKIEQGIDDLIKEGEPYRITPTATIERIHVNSFRIKDSLIAEDRKVNRSELIFYLKAHNKAVESIEKKAETPLATETIDNKKSIAHGQEVNISPSEPMKEAGNYKKSHVLVDGLEISVENTVGSERTGTDDDGKTWSQTMKSDYGYFKGSVGYDKDHVDTFLKPSYKGGNDTVHVVNQANKDGSFDEHKVVLGATSEKDAMLIYNSNYEKGWTGGKSVVAMPLEQFKEWVKSDGPAKGELIEDEVKPAEKTVEELTDFVLWSIKAAPQILREKRLGDYHWRVNKRPEGWDKTENAKKAHKFIIGHKAARKLQIVYDGEEAGGHASFTFQGGLMAGITFNIDLNEDGSIDREKFDKGYLDKIELFRDELELYKKEGSVLTKINRLTFDKELIEEIDREVRENERRIADEAKKEVQPTGKREQRPGVRGDREREGDTGRDEGVLKSIEEVEGLEPEPSPKEAPEELLAEQRPAEPEKPTKQEALKKKVAERKVPTVPTKESVKKVEELTRDEKFLKTMGLLKPKPEAVVEEIAEGPVKYDKKDAEWHGLEDSSRTQLLKDAKNVGLKYKVGQKGITKDVLIRDILEKLNAGEIPEYAKFATAEAPGPSQSTKEKLTSAVDDLLTRKGRENLNIVVVQTTDDLAKIIKKPVSAVRQAANYKGTTYLVADNIPVDRVWPMVLHEGVHGVRAAKGWSGVFGRQAPEILALVDEKLKLNDKAWKAAEQKAVDAGTPSENILEETITYFLADKANKKQSLWRRIASAVRAWALRVGIKSKVTDADIVALAENAVRRAAGGPVEDAAISGALDLEPAFADKPLWHSRLRRLVNDFQVEKQPASAWLQTFNGWKKKGKLPPALQEELEWSGLEEVLTMRGKEKITKGEVLDLLRVGGVQVEETVLGDISDRTQEEGIMSSSEKLEFSKLLKEVDYLGFDRRGQAKRAVEDHEDWAERWDVLGNDRLIELGELHRKYKAARKARLGGRAKFKSYQLPGGENYREMLVTLPTKIKAISEDTANDQVLVYQDKLREKYGDLPYDELIQRASTTERAELARLDDLLSAGMRQTEEGEIFKSSHFDQPNVLAHVRFNERTDAGGNKVLFIEEIQSDWHQKGRKGGYAIPKKEQEEIDRMVKRIDDVGGIDNLPEVERAKAREMSEQLVRVDVAPDAPFKKTWPLLTIKRMISYATENGFDKIAWTTGEQQAERYDLSKQVDEINWARRIDGTHDVTILIKEQDTPIIKDALTDSQLEELIGKEAAKKIIESESTKDIPLKEYEGRGTLKGDDLKVGGEGMKGFYDKILPSTVGKFIKKYDGKVGKSDIDVTDQGFRGRRREYTWPEMTVAGVQKVFDVADSGGPGVYISPVTGEKQDFVVNRVANANPLRAVLGKMKDGVAFKDAVAEHASPGLAELFGAKIEEFRDKKTKTVHSLDITPQMKEAVATEGMPLFSTDTDTASSFITDKASKTKHGPLTHDHLTKAQEKAIIKGGFGVGKEDESRPLLKLLKDRGKRKLLKVKLRQGLVDQYGSFKDIIGSKEAWMMAHLTKSGAGVLETIFRHGEPVLDASGAVTYKKGNSLTESLVPLGKEIDLWLSWMAGNRAAILRSEDRERLFSDVDIAALKSLDNGVMPDGRNRREVYLEAKKNYESMNRAVVKIGVKTGLISPEDAKAWEQQGFYVPFYRMAEEGDAHGPRGGSRRLTNQTAYKKLKGADMPLDDLLTNILSNWNHIITGSLNNQTASKALDAAVDMDLATEIPDSLHDKNSIYIRREGRRVWFDVDDTAEGKLVLESLLSLNWDGFNNPAMKAMRAFKRLLTTGVTASPGFKIRNLLRDTIHAAAVTNVSPTMIDNIFTGWRATGKEPGVKMVAGGGAFGQSGYIHGADPDAVKRLVGVEKGSILNTRTALKKLWDAYQDFGARLENINRAANFERDLAEGKSLLEANFNARDQLDFTRTGTFAAIRFIAQTVPFLNARLQGLDKLGRSALGSKKERRRFATVAGAYTMASVLLYLGMADDDDYEKAEDWEKRTYHLFKLPGSEMMYRLPRPFEIGALAYMTEKMTQQVVEDVPYTEFSKELKNTMLDTFAFNPIPQAFKPMVELYANKNMFTGRDIESLGMKFRSKTERYRGGTTSIAKGVGKAISKVAPDGVTPSPVQIDHLVRSYGGWLSSTIVAGTDMLVREMIGSPVKPAKKIYEYAPVKSFVRESEGRSSKYVTIFYDNLDLISKAYGDIKYYRETSPEHAKKLIGKYGDVVKWRKSYNTARGIMARLRKQKDLVYKNRTISADRKRKRIENINIQINNIAKKIWVVSSEDLS